MGTRMAPSYANLFMGKLEREFLLTQDIEPQVWWRFIDDIFAIWTHGEHVLCRFIESLNPHHPTVKFTSTWSAEQVTFLDTTVYPKDGQISTDLYTKPTDKHQYLHMDSCHPFHCKASIPYSQALPLRRIHSEKKSFIKNSRNERVLSPARLWRAACKYRITESATGIHITRETCLQSKQNQDKPARIRWWLPTILFYHLFTRRPKDIFRFFRSRNKHGRHFGYRR